MAEKAQVRSIEALRAFKAALADFEDASRQALAEAQGQVQRAVGWLQNDRSIYWRQQLKYRQNRLSDAKSELMRAEMATETKTSAVVERKNVQKWKQAVEEAEQKLRSIKRWLRLIEREQALFKAKCQPLGRIIEGEMPKAHARLDRYYATLEKYVRLTPPGGRTRTTGPAGGAGAEPGEDETSDDES